MSLLTGLCEPTPLLGFMAQATEQDNATLREMLDLAFRVPTMSDTELAEFIRNFRGHIDAARKEQP